MTGCDNVLQAPGFPRRELAKILDLHSRQGDPDVDGAQPDHCVRPRQITNATTAATVCHQRGGRSPAWTLLEEEEMTRSSSTCPPSLGILTTNALAAVHEVLIPIETDYLALLALEPLVTTRKEIELEIKSTPSRVLDSSRQAQKRTEHSRGIVDEIRKAFLGRVLEANPVLSSRQGKSHFRVDLHLRSQRSGRRSMHFSPAWEMSRSIRSSENHCEAC